MNKDKIISILNQYDFDKNNFYVISGAALVLLNVIEKTKDIDICVSKEYYRQLLKEYNCVFERTNEYGNDTYMIDNVINFGISFMPNDYEIISDYKVASLKDCYKLKLFLNREKDKELLKQLKKII